MTVSATDDLRWVRPTRVRADTPRGIEYLEVGPGFRGRPGLHVDAQVTRRGPGYDWFIGLRVRVGPRTAAWALVDDWWNDVTFALNPEVAHPLSLPHIRATDVESGDWTRWLRAALHGAGSPVYPGLWQVAEMPLMDRSDPRHAYAPRPARLTVPTPWPQFYETQAFDDVLPIRPPSPELSGRVKWYRKLARQDALPPVFVMYVAPVLGWVVLDGHDRLLAAALEDRKPRFIGLSSVQQHALTPDPIERAKVEQSLAAALAAKPDDPRAVQGVNRALIAMYEDSYMTLRQRAWPIPGGLAAWTAGLDGLRADNEASEALLADMRYASECR